MFWCSLDYFVSFSDMSCIISSKLICGKSSGRSSVFVVCFTAESKLTIIINNFYTIYSNFLPK